MSNIENEDIFPKRSKLLLKLVVGLFVLLGFCFFLPQIVSTDWSKRKIEAHLEGLLGGAVSIEKLTLNWWGNQSCHQVQWIDTANGIALTADRVNISANLLDCLKYREKPLNVVVEGAKMSCPGKLKFLKKKKNVQLQFSPIHAFIQEGKITLDKTEIKVTRSMKVFTWGTIDLNQNQMNMTLGLPPRTLKKIFRSINLPENFLLEIPISSSLDSKSLEKKLMTFFLKNYTRIKSM